MKHLYKYTTKLIISALLIIFIYLSIAGTYGIYLLNQNGFYRQTQEELRNVYITEITNSYLYELNDYFNDRYLKKNVNAQGQFQNVISLNRTNFRYTIYLRNNKSNTFTAIESNYGGEEIATSVEMVSGSDYNEKAFAMLIEEVEASQEVLSASKGEYEIVLVGYALRTQTVRDRYITDNHIYILDHFYPFRYALVLFSVFSWVGSCVLFLLLSSVSGHVQGQDDIKIRTYERIPLDLLLGINLIALYYTILIIQNTSFDMGVFVFLFAVSFIVIIFSVENWISICIRVKSGTWYQTMLLYHLGKRALKIVLQLSDSFNVTIANLPIYWGTLIVFAIWSIGDLIRKILLWIVLYNPYIIDGFFESIERMAVIVFACLLSVQFHALMKKAQDLEKGIYGKPINTTWMFGPFRKTAISLNNITKGMDIAVQEQMKSEHMRTELITNVSHDIKTPLTSIISYVDLLKKKNIQDEDTQEYIDVIDRQARRLKKLVDDIVESSKASTGNIKMNMEPMDLDIMLEQVIAEYDERLSNKSLEVVYKPLNSSMMILADGEHLWRVFDNLFSNICKYAQEQTRVYVSVFEKGDEISVIMKNVSAYSLDISADELMERFVRGDASRNTEGSGLGVSITKSLVELQDGKFDISIDGDLFKTCIRLKKMVSDVDFYS